MPDDEMTPERIQAIREGNFLTQQELANAVGVRLRAVQYWLAGDRAPRGPAAKILLQLEQKARENKEYADAIRRRSRTM